MKLMPALGTMLLALFSIAPAIHAQVGQPSDLSEILSTQDRQEAERQRTVLIERGDALRQKLAAFKQQCGHVAENDSSLVAQCRSSQAALVAEMRQYNQDVDDFNKMVARMASAWKGKSAECANATEQARRDREAVERQIHSNELNQQELEEWNSLNGKAQKDAVVSSAKYFLGEFVSNIDPVRSSVSKLESRAAELANKSIKSRRLATRAKYAAQLGAVLNELEPMQGNLYAKLAVNAGLDANKTWELARDTMQHQFRVARKQNENIREMLRDPAFKEAFAGEDTDTPGENVVYALADQAAEETGKCLSTLEQYDQLVGPTIRAGVFVRDLVYSDLLSYYSTKRVLQASDLAGNFAKSSAALQKQYQKSVDAVHACRQYGFLK
jgi:hypothetical protein